MLMLMSFPLFLFGFVKSETEIHRECRSIAPRKVFARQESFSTEHTFVYYIRNLSGISLKFLESFWIVRKVSRFAWMFLNCLESFGFVWKFSVLSGKYTRPRNLPDFLASYQIVWKLSKMSGKFPDCFWMICNFTIVSGKFPDCLETF